MVVCERCGHENPEGEDFCGECGSYLEWEGRRVVTEVEDQAAEPEPEPHAERRPTLVQRVVAAASRTGTAPDDRSAPSGPPDTATAVDVPSTAPASPATTATPATPATPAAAPIDPR